MNVLLIKMVLFDRKKLENQLERNSQAWHGSITSILRNRAPDKKDKNRHEVGKSQAELESSG